MGFMDKAKKLAEQAQQKLDEAQNQFNQGSSPGQEQAGGGVRYDEHGRPIQEDAAAGPTPPPAAQPAAPAPDPTAAFGDAGPGAPAAPAPESAPPPAAPASPAAAEPQPAAEEPAPPPSGGANSTPDPFKPLQQ